MSKNELAKAFIEKYYSSSDAPEADNHSDSSSKCNGDCSTKCSSGQS